MSILSQSFPPKAKWSAKDIPDLSEKVMIVTGGNSGIGRETVKALLSHNAKVYMASRSKVRAMQAISELKVETGKEAVFLELDLADLRAIKTAAAEFLSKESRLHVLFNSGGVMIPPLEDLTADGYDLQFGVNVLGHFYFTQLLLPALLAVPQSCEEKARVVTTSSLGHIFTPLNFEAFCDGPTRVKMGRQELYQMSKYGDTVFAAELARRYRDQGIVSIAVNPGNINSDLNRNASAVQKVLSKLLFYPTDKGALTQLYAGVAPDASKMSGKYLIPWARLGEARLDALEPKTGERLWKWMEEQVSSI
ncbi:uncharacterized protein FIBRA_07653 [Fibroporia radiculosa]|uniref:NAD(P)-binding protein n=1 Tax=Fibroporia radiculosa TaxID=599839 RepID=J4H4R2_9APHY|nr:uncharacterized protein FIBRA_07653 [Fibroporia radiculosa]CCM05434.1 predicted protein [Fibroporia radiculosa]